MLYHSSALEFIIERYISIVYYYYYYYYNCIFNMISYQRFTL